MSWDHANEALEELLHRAMRDNLRGRGEASAAVPMLIRWSSDAEVPSWDELAELHPEVGDGGFLLVPDALWPDPTAGTWSMGAFE